MLQSARWSGMLELIVAAPRSFSLILTSMTLALETTAVFSFAATLVMGRYLFGIPVRIDDPALFTAAVLLTMVAMGMFGFLLAVRPGGPVPVSVGDRQRAGVPGLDPVRLPGPPDAAARLGAAGLRRAGAPWGIEAMRAAAGGQSPWRDLLICAALGAAYVVIGALVARAIVRSAGFTQPWR